MINQERVRRIKNAIYIFITLLFLVPAILLIVLGVKMVRYIPELERLIEENTRIQAEVAGNQAPGSLPEVSPDWEPPIPPPSSPSVPEEESKEAPASEEELLLEPEEEPFEGDSATVEGPSVALSPGEASPPETADGGDFLTYGDIQSPNTGRRKPWER